MTARSADHISQLAQPASAATNQFKGVNWADTRDNYNTGWVIPDGLAASDDYSVEADDGSGLSNNNASAVTQVRWGWGD